MAVLKNGPNGGFSGRVGNIVGYQWKGIDVIRSLPRQSNKPRSEAQMANQLAMKLAMNFLAPISGILRIGYAGEVADKRMTPFNRALSYHKKNAIAGTYPELHFDFERALIGMGDLKPLDGITASWSDSGLQIRWATEETKRTKSFEDNLFILLYFSQQDHWDVRTSGITREMGEYNFEIKDYLHRQEAHLYLMLTNPIHGKVSTSQHFHVPAVSP